MLLCLDKKSYYLCIIIIIIIVYLLFRTLISVLFELVFVATCNVFSEVFEREGTS